VADRRVTILCPESVLTTVGYRKLLECSSNRVLGRIFVDEAHVYATQDHFRTKFSNVFHLGAYGVPITFMTGTASEAVIQRVLAMFGLGRNVFVLNPHVRRNDLQYEIVESPVPEYLLERIVGEYGALESGRKMILFAHSRDRAAELAEFCRSKDMTVFQATAEMPRSERDAAITSFKSAGKSVMVATSLLAEGVDIGEVSTVVMAGLPYSVEQYAQMCGRAGRDGTGGKCVLVFDGSRYQVDKAGRTAVEQNYLADMNTVARNVTVCRKQVLDMYFRKFGLDCSDGPDETRCDICRLRASRPQSRPADQFSGPDPYAAVESSVARNRAFAVSSAVARQSDFAHNVLGILRIFERSGSVGGKPCIICAVRFGRLVVHTSQDKQNCFFAKRCVFCGFPASQHTEPKCKFRLARATAVCLKCLCPSESGGVIFHHDKMYSNCVGDFYMVAYKCAIAAFHNGDNRGHADFSRFIEFALAKNGDFANAVHIMVEYCTKFL
jgi:hypothetical protein